MGRPPFCREAFLTILSGRANHRGLVLVNEVALAYELDCHRSSVGRMLDELERQGRLKRRWRRGPKGLILQIQPARSVL